MKNRTLLSKKVASNCPTRIHVLYCVNSDKLSVILLVIWRFLVNINENSWTSWTVGTSRFLGSWISLVI